MGMRTEIVRAKVMRAKGAKMRADGVALGNEHLKAQGQRYQVAGRTAEARARASRQAPEA